MQFFAFLKDSYREIKSGWMLLIMLILSGFFLVLIASIGFRPATVQDELADRLGFINLILKSNPPEYAKMGQPEFSIDNVTASNKKEPWKSDYAFDYIIKCPTSEDMRKARQLGGGAERGEFPTTRAPIRRFIRQNLRDYEKVEVEELTVPEDDNAAFAVAGAVLAADPPVLPAEVRYRVSVSGSKIDDPLAWPHQVSVLFFWEVPHLRTSLRDGMYFLEKWVIDKIGGWVLLFIGVIATASFIPSMLAKGSLDLVLAKPIGRSRLFVYKYCGGLLFVLVLISVMVLGFWVIVGLRSGIWTANFLATIPVLTFYFAILYSVSVLTATLTRNALVSILVTLCAWGLLWGIGKLNDGVENRRELEAALKEKKGNVFLPQNDEDGQQADNPLARIDPDAPLWGFIPRSTFPVITVIQAVSPRTFQLDDRLSHEIASGILSPYQLKKNGYDKPPRESWGEIVGVSLVFIAAMLALACWRFESRDH